MTTRTSVAAAPTTAWRNRTVGSGEEAPDQLLANPRNWRLHPRNQQAALAGALDAVGWVQQVTVNQRTGFVVEGHARVALAFEATYAPRPPPRRPDRGAGLRGDPQHRRLREPPVLRSLQMPPSRSE